MFLQTVCLLIAAALVSAGDPVEDPFNALKIKAFEPGHENNQGDTLKMRCSIDITRTNFVNLTKLKFYGSDVYDAVNFQTLGSVTEDKFSYGLTRKEITVGGRFRLDTDYRSKLEITWVSQDSGYCTLYKCVATGRDPNNGKLLAIYKIFQVNTADGQCCNPLVD
ncbi:hypothetical protein PoB_002033200 [Plakobranchus ocellatus]|uniref:Uncharacterized protein n=1 Tax=Plakobranchus ocellatus TaxID=259542 RepID=A0AAV3ZEV4_9GAST|nr:hypothetical protein PoB_002033200 [Plakobranchus ocellatus]